MEFLIGLQIKDVLCDICGKAFAHQRTMASHRLWHTSRSLLDFTIIILEQYSNNIHNFKHATVIYQLKRVSMNDRCYSFSIVSEILFLRDFRQRQIQM